jgi:hypothetical protein
VLAGTRVFSAGASGLLVPQISQPGIFPAGSSVLAPVPGVTFSPVFATGAAIQPHPSLTAILAAGGGAVGKISGLQLTYTGALAQAAAAINATQVQTHLLLPAGGQLVVVPTVTPVVPALSASAALPTQPYVLAPGGAIRLYASWSLTTLAGQWGAPVYYGVWSLTTLFGQWGAPVYYGVWSLTTIQAQWVTGTLTP